MIAGGAYRIGRIGWAGGCREGASRRVGVTGLLGALLLVGVAGVTAAEIAPADTRHIREQFRHYEQRRESVRQWELDAALSRRVERLTELVRQEFEGRQRRHAISEQEMADLERGLPETGLIPLDQMPADATYKGEDGGLYGNGRNEPPPAHRAAAERALAAIEPRDRDGEPAADGKVVLLGLGMSNTRQAFDAFERIAADEPQIAEHVVLVNGAVGGQDARRWADPEADFGRRPRIPTTGEPGTPWDYADAALEQADVSAAQVQAVWIKQAMMGPARYGAFPDHAELLAECIGVKLREAKRRYPNLQVAYLSSRTYAGYAVRPLNPEPFAYESAFAVRRVIQQQIDGEARYNHDPSHGEVAAPVLMWGPYLWADGQTPRASDGLSWTREDFTPVPDGTHPSATGQRKAGELLLRFFKHDPLASSWFSRSGGERARDAGGRARQRAEHAGGRAARGTPGAGERQAGAPRTDRDARAAHERRQARDETAGRRDVPSGDDRWRELDVDGPSVRHSHAMAYDSDREVILLFGGLDGGPRDDPSLLGDTWQWDGQRWTKVAEDGPSPRMGHAMVYDSRRGVVVLFGRQDGATWEWDGEERQWRQVATNGPRWRGRLGLAYDRQRGVTVLFGGIPRELGDTWAWDGEAWRQMAEPGPDSPSGRSRIAMAYDPVRQVTLMFGGRAPDGRNIGDTWAWDGQRWQEVSDAGELGRSRHVMAWDSDREVMVSFAGMPYHDDTIEWDGQSWRRVARGGPSSRVYYDMAYHAASGQMVLFGGWDGGQALADTWVYELPAHADTEGE